MLLKFPTAFFTETDPGFLAAKRSLKTLVAILLSLIVYHNQPKLALLAVIAALLFSRSQVGTTIEERKFTMIITGLLMTLLSVPVSLISGNDSLSVIFVFLFAFFVFFFIGLKLIPDFPAIVVLSLSVVQMAFSHSVSSGLKYSALYALITGLVFVIHFLIFPTRPRKRLQLQAGFMVKNLEMHYRVITNSYPDLDTAISASQQSIAGLRKSLKEFHRLWQLFRISITDDNSDEGRLMRLSLGIEKVADTLVMTWQFRAEVWKSNLYQKLIVEEPVINQVFDEIFGVLNPDTCGQKKDQMVFLSKKIEKLQQDYMSQYSEDATGAEIEEWIAVFNTLNVIREMMLELVIFRPDVTISIPEFSIKAKLRELAARLKTIIPEFKFSNAAFRFGLRSAIIVGIAQAFYLFIEPEYGYWLVLFAVLLIRPNLGISIRTGRERLLGTVLGGVAAFLFLSLLPPESPSFYVGLLLGVYLMIWFANLNKPFEMVIALTFVIIAVFSILYASNEKLIVLRILYTAGVVVLVIAASSLLWPEKARKKLASTLADTIEMEKNYFMLIIKSLNPDNDFAGKAVLKSSLDLQLKKLDEVMEASKSEVLQVKTLTHGLKIRIYIKRMLNTLHSLDMNAQPSEFEKGAEGIRTTIEAFAGRINLAFDALTGALRSYSFPQSFPELEHGLHQMIEQFRQTRKLRSKENMELTNLWRNSSFIWNLKPLIKELEGIREEIVQKMNGL